MLTRKFFPDYSPAIIHRVLLLGLLYQFIWAPELLYAASKNGFDLSNSEISARKIKSGGPPRDGIPAIDRPRFVSAADAAEFMQAHDRVVGLKIKDQWRAYPIKILNYHEIVNDNIDGQGVLISYCPLCGTAMAFRSTVNGQDLSFGVSGLLYNSDVLMYDRQTESLWSQILGRAISGPLKGARLQSVPVIHTDWQGWLQSHPQSSVLSTQTGYARDYSSDPYAGYGDSKKLWFPVANRDRRYANKEWVIALEVGGLTRAWPFSELDRSWQENPQQSYLDDKLNGQSVRIYYQPANHSAYITDDSGDLLSGISAYWFAWIAFHPQSEVFIGQVPGR